MMRLVRWLKQKREEIHLEREVKSFCCYLNRILFKERLILLRKQDETYCRICECTLYNFADGVGKKKFGDGKNKKNKEKNEKIQRILKESMKSTVLAVVVSASENGKDYYGFWLAGGSWHIFPREKLLTKKAFFC